MDIPLAEGRMQGYRQFINKIWNASRFVIKSVPPNQPALDLETFLRTRERQPIEDRLTRVRPDAPPVLLAPVVEMPHRNDGDQRILARWRRIGIEPRGRVDVQAGILWQIAQVRDALEVLLILIGEEQRMWLQFWIVLVHTPEETDNRTRELLVCELLSCSIPR